MTRRIAFLIGLLLQLIAIFGLFVPYVLLVRGGTVIALKTTPVDPFSLLRGEYVMLGYDVGNDLPVGIERPVVYAVLRRGDDGFYERVRFTTERPVLQPWEVCLRGIPAYNRAIFPDIAQYFVEEGMGSDLEQARNARRLYVDAVVDGRCRSMIKGIRLGPEVPQSEWPTEPFPGGPRPVKRAPMR